MPDDKPRKIACCRRDQGHTRSRRGSFIRSSSHPNRWLRGDKEPLGASWAEKENEDFKVASKLSTLFGWRRGSQSEPGLCYHGSPPGRRRGSQSEPNCRCFSERDVCQRHRGGHWAPLGFAGLGCAGRSVPRFAHRPGEPSWAPLGSVGRARRFVARKAPSLFCHVLAPAHKKNAKRKRLLAKRDFVLNLSCARQIPSRSLLCCLRRPRGACVNTQPP